MTPRPKPLPPDTRPDWRDPNMPVLVSLKSAGNALVPWDSERFRRATTIRLELSSEPTHRNDPTYNLRAKRAKGNQP